MFFHVASLIYWQGPDQPFLEQKIALLKFLNHPNLVRHTLPCCPQCGQVSVSYTVISLCVCSPPPVRWGWRKCVGRRATGIWYRS